MAKGKKGPRNLVIFTAIIVVLFVLLYVLNQATNEPAQKSSSAGAPDISAQPTLGNKDSGISVVEFGDFKCPSCKIWTEQFFPKLKADYIDTGKISFSYINTPFHGEESITGALAAESIWATNPDAYWGFHDALFANQPTSDHDNAWLTVDKVMEIAAKIEPKIDLDKLKADVESQATKPQVDDDISAVNKFKVNQTPTIMVNDSIQQNVFSYEELVQLIEEKIKASK